MIHARYISHRRSRSTTIVVLSIDTIDESCHLLRITLGSEAGQEKVQKIGNRLMSDGKQWREGKLSHFEQQERRTSGAEVGCIAIDA